MAVELEPMAAVVQPQGKLEGQELREQDKSLMLPRLGPVQGPGHGRLHRKSSSSCQNQFNTESQGQEGTPATQPSSEAKLSLVTLQLSPGDVKLEGKKRTVKLEGKKSAVKCKGKKHVATLEDEVHEGK